MTGLKDIINYNIMLTLVLGIVLLFMWTAYKVVPPLKISIVGENTAYIELKKQTDELVKIVNVQQYQIDTLVQMLEKK